MFRFWYPNVRWGWKLALSMQSILSWLPWVAWYFDRDPGPWCSMVCHLSWAEGVKSTCQMVRSFNLRTRCGVLIFVKGSCLWLWRAWVEGGLSVRCSSFRVESGLGIELVPAKDCLTWNISGLCGEDGLSCIPTISAGVCSGMNCVLQQCYTGLWFSKREMCKWTAGQQRSGTGLQTRYRG